MYISFSGREEKRKEKSRHSRVALVGRYLVIPIKLLQLQLYLYCGLS